MRTASLVLLTLAITGCGNQPPKGLVLNRSLENLIPPDTVVLAGARIQEIQTTPLYQRLVGERKVSGIDEFIKKTGLDPRRDIDEILFASNGKEGVTIARGRIPNQSALEAVLEKEGHAQRVPAGKHTLFVNDQNAVVFIEGGLVMAGPTKYLQSVLTGTAKDDAPKLNVLDRLASLSQDRHVWAVAVGGFAPIPLPEKGNLANLGRIFGSLETTTMTLDLRHGLNLSATGQCSNETNAKQLHDALRGLIGFGRLSTSGDNPELLKFFDSIKVDQSEKKVRLNADVPMDMVEQFLKLTEKRKPAA